MVDIKHCSVVVCGYWNNFANYKLFKSSHCVVHCKKFEVIDVTTSIYCYCLMNLPEYFFSGFPLLKMRCVLFGGASYGAKNTVIVVTRLKKLKQYIVLSGYIPQRAASYTFAILTCFVTLQAAEREETFSKERQSPF